MSLNLLILALNFMIDCPFGALHNLPFWDYELTFWLQTFAFILDHIWTLSPNRLPPSVKFRSLWFPEPVITTAEFPAVNTPNMFSLIPEVRLRLRKARNQKDWVDVVTWPLRTKVVSEQGGWEEKEHFRDKEKQIEKSGQL